MIPTTTSQFEDDATLSDYLGDELRSSRLALVLGAGLSAPFKLPTWDELVDACCLAKSITIPAPRPDNRDLAEEVRIACKMDDVYLELVRRQLYAGRSVTMESLTANRTLSAIAALAMGSVRGTVGNVITYNFDDLLELHLSYHGFKIHRVSDVPAWNEKADIRILHPHGFLPSPMSLWTRTDWILFDRRSYSERAAREPLWREEQLPILRRNTCLLIGLSNRDGELDTLIAEVSASHPCSGAGVPYWGVRFAERSGDRATDERATETARLRGLFLKYVADYETDLPRFLFTVCQKAAGIRM